MAVVVMAADKTPSSPTIRSYVLRHGRITKGQQRAWEQHAVAYSIPAAAKPPHWENIFHRCAPLIVEIGSGDGMATAEIAAAHPQNDYIAFEVYRAGVGALFNRLSATGLENVRVVAADAAVHLPLMFANVTLAGVNIFFPDPWRKKRHHKRRLIQPPFVAMLADKIKAGGFVHFATDWRDYTDQATTVFAGNSLFVSATPPSRPQTKFEHRATGAVWDLFYYKR